MSITEYAMLISAITLTANVAFTDLSTHIEHMYRDIGIQLEQSITIKK